MAKLSIIFTLLCFSTLIANSQSLFQESKTIVPPFRVYTIQNGMGPNANVLKVARSSISTTATSFGIIYAGDFEIHAGPDPNSQLLGRVQGTSTTTSLVEPEPEQIVDYNFVFTAGKYRGSSLNFAGQRTTFVPNQEIPIAGGTGRFRGARGYAIVTFISYTPATDTYVFVYNINVQ